MDFYNIFTLILIVLSIDFLAIKTVFILAFFCLIFSNSFVFLVIILAISVFIAGVLWLPVFLLIPLIVVNVSLLIPLLLQYLYLFIVGFFTSLPFRVHIVVVDIVARFFNSFNEILGSSCRVLAAV